MSSYKVRYERDEDGWWIARVVGVAGVHSNGRTIDEARRRVREALSLAVDDADTAELVDDIRLPRDLRKLLRQQQKARENAAQAQEEANALGRKVVRRLTKELHLSRRDVGTLLQVSGQMVQKLAKKSRSKRRAS
jgi:predicted RNase H-like HicB family nuclease